MVDVLNRVDHAFAELDLLDQRIARLTAVARRRVGATADPFCTGSGARGGVADGADGCVICPTCHRRVELDQARRLVLHDR